MNSELRCHLLGEFCANVFGLQPCRKDPSDLCGEGVEVFSEAFHWNQQPSRKLVGILLQSKTRLILCFEVARELVERRKFHVRRIVTVQDVVTEFVGDREP